MNQRTAAVAGSSVIITCSLALGVTARTRAGRTTSVAVAFMALIAMVVLLCVIPPSECKRGSAGGGFAINAYKSPKRVTWAPSLTETAEYDKHEAPSAGVGPPRRRSFEPLTKAPAPTMPDHAPERFRPSYTGSFGVPARRPPDRKYTAPINMSQAISDQMRMRNRHETPLDAFYARDAAIRHAAAYVSPDRDPHMRRIV